MKRTQHDDEGSLELLLDTICNTFGGVLFISILVALMLNVSSNQVMSDLPNESQRTELLDAQSRLSDTSHELDVLTQAMQAQANVEKQVVAPDLQVHVRTIRQVQEVTAAKAARQLKEVDQLAEQQVDINAWAQQIKETKEALKNAQRNITVVEREVLREIESRTRAAKLPRSHRTTKQEVAMFLKDGRLCSYVRRRQNRLVVNTDEVSERQDEDGREYIEPRSGKGIPIKLEDAGLDARLSEFTGDKHYIAVFVWPDSFAHFQILKDRLVAHELEYRLVPFFGDRRIHFGAVGDQLVQ